MLRHDWLSFCPYGTTRLPLDRLSRNLIFEVFRNPIEKTQFSLKSDKNNGNLT